MRCFVNVSGIVGRVDTKLICGTRIVGMNHKTRKEDKVFIFLLESSLYIKDILMFLLRSVCSNFIDNSFAFCFGFVLVVVSLAINSTQMQSISVSKFIACIFLTWK